MTISLADLQRRLAGLLTAPPPVDDAERSAREEMALSLGVVGDARLDAGGRAGIYAGMWFARIHDAIAEDYPATRLALGDAAFAEMLRGYLAECPPTDPSLRHAGDRLAGHLARHRRPAHPPWLAELAGFEQAIAVAFDAPDERALTADALSRVSPEDWPALELRFVASLLVLRPSHPVDAIRERLLASASLDSMPAPPAALFTWRQDERVFHRRADAFESALVDAARERRGIDFAALCEVADRELGPPVGARDAGGGERCDAATALLARLELWLRDALLADTRSPG